MLTNVWHIQLWQYVMITDVMNSREDIIVNEEIRVAYNCILRITKFLLNIFLFLILFFREGRYMEDGSTQTSHLSPGREVRVRVRFVLERIDELSKNIFRKYFVTSTTIYLLVMIDASAVLFHVYSNYYLQVKFILVRVKS